jgi:hypothetical protein
MHFITLHITHFTMFAPVILHSTEHIVPSHVQQNKMSDTHDIAVTICHGLYSNLINPPFASSDSIDCGQHFLLV